MPTTTTESDTDNDHHPAGSPSATTKQTHPARSYACHGPNSTYRSGYISSHLGRIRSPQPASENVCNGSIDLVMCGDVSDPIGFDQNHPSLRRS